MHVIIAGAGIGGLTTALCCLNEGLKVTLLEQAAELKEIGAGVQISSNGSVVLRELGLLDLADRVAVKPVSFRVLSFETDEIISDMPLGVEAESRYGGPFYQFHRADLLDALKSKLPSDVLKLESKVVDVAQTDRGVTAILANGEKISGDVLVGADGIHSIIRSKIVGDGPTSFSGKLVWRALIPAERIGDLNFKERFYGWAGLDRMVWAYWVRPGEMFNFGGVVPSAEVKREAWSQTGDLGELRASFVGANARLAALIERIDEAFITGLYDRDPLPRWTAGRATLIGDAAHAMLPYLAQGATQSVEDGYVLAKCLAAQPSDVAGALAMFELKRRPRTTKVQTVARSTHIFWTEGDPVQVQARNGRMAGLAQIDPLATTVWKWLYGYSPIKAALTKEIAPDKRGVRSVHPGDTAPQQRAWDMWHDLFTMEEEAGGVRGLRRGYDRFFGQFQPAADTSVSEVAIGEATGLWVDGAGARKQKVVLHLHGGGFAFGSARCSVEYCERLSTAIDGRCLALEYRLAPEHPFPAALDDAVFAYRWLLDKGYAADSIYLSGESAGGGLAISAAVAIRDAGLPQPAGVMVLSPFVDLSLQSPSIDRLEGADPIIDRDILTYMSTGYFQKESAKDPRISPVFADLTGLPPLLIQASRDEVLIDDARRLADRAEASKVEVIFSVYDERLHIFSLYPFLPNSDVALREVADFVAKSASVVRDKARLQA